MKCHLLFPLSLMVILLLVAFCTGSVLFYTLALLLLLLTLGGFFSVLLASRTLTASAEISEETVRRGEDVSLLLSVRHRGFLPIAPILLELAFPSGADREVRLRDLPGRLQTLRMPVRTAHIGAFSAGIRSCTVEDLLGLFERKIDMEQSLFEVVVLPRTFDIEPLTLSPGDPGSEIMQRATEDLNAPSDVRSYQPGDAMKKIHWKLSLRKGELMVRRFDEPVLQDVLILLDCSRPPSLGHPQAEADVRDALLETAASVFADQLKTDHALRLPLPGAHPVDLEKGTGLAIAFEDLARVDFSEADRFERVLTLESRRLRKVGCTVVISARLTSGMVDVMIRMHRMGPTLRFYLITFVPDDPNLMRLTSRLRQSGIEVASIVPEPSEGGEGKGGGTHV